MAGSRGSSWKSVTKIEHPTTDVDMMESKPPPGPMPLLVRVQRLEKQEKGSVQLHYIRFRTVVMVRSVVAIPQASASWEAPCSGRQSNWIDWAAAWRQDVHSFQQEQSPKTNINLSDVLTNSSCFVFEIMHVQNPGYWFDCSRLSPFNQMDWKSCTSPSPSNF